MEEINGQIWFKVLVFVIGIIIVSIIISITLVRIFDEKDSKTKNIEILMKSKIGDKITIHAFPCLTLVAFDCEKVILSHLIDDLSIEKKYIFEIDSIILINESLLQREKEKNKS